MWKAEKIVLKTNRELQNDDVNDYSLKINGQEICNAISNPKMLWDGRPFYIWVCDACGSALCSNGGMLMIRKHGNALLFLPAFDWMDDFQEYDDEGNGNSDCPPHRWFEEGILIVEGDALNELYNNLWGLVKSEIPEISVQEMDYMLDWESLVKGKPKRLINY